MATLETLHQLESQIGYDLPYQLADEILDSQNDDIMYLSELYGLPILTTLKSDMGKTTIVNTTIVWFGENKRTVREEIVQNERVAKVEKLQFGKALEEIKHHLKETLICT